jgi:membrane protease YdiL (CAAX protease family)
MLMSLMELPSSTLESIAGMVRHSSAWEFALSFLLIGVIGPILEELIFRGYIQTRLVMRHGAIAGILITSAFFGLFHLNLVQGGFAFLLGLFLGTVAYRARSIYPAIACHMAVNIVSTVSLAMGVGGREHWGVVMVCCAVVLGGSLVYLVRVRAIDARGTQTCAGT